MFENTDNKKRGRVGAGTTAGTLVGDRLLALDDRRQALEAEWLSTLREFADQALHTVDGAPSPAAWLAHRCEISRRRAAQDAKTAQHLRRMPVAAAAMADGSLSPAKVQLLAKARDLVEPDDFAEHEEFLVGLIADLSVDQAAHAVRFWVRRAEAESEAGQDDAGREEWRRDKRTLHLSAIFDGTWKLDATLDPEVGAFLAAAIDARYEQLRRNEEPDHALRPGQRRADALVDLVLTGTADEDEPEHEPEPEDHSDGCDQLDDRNDAYAYTNGNGSDEEPVDTSVRNTRRTDNSTRPTGSDPPTLKSQNRSVAPRRSAPPARPTLSGLLDLNALDGGREVVGELFAGVPLRRDAAKRLLCNCALARVVFNASQPVDLGRKRRLPTPAQRRALVARDGGCTFPGCERPPDWCEAHHLVHWIDGGKTDLDNLAMLCRYHHHLVHEGGFTLERQADGTLRCWRPDGTELRSARRRPPTLFEHTGTHPPPARAA